MSAKEKMVITSLNLSELASPVDISKVLIRVYTMISRNQVDTVNKTRESNGLKPLVPNTKSDSPGSRPDKAFHMHMDLDFSQKNIGGRMLGDLVTNPIDPAILADWIKGVSYDNSFKSAAQKLWETSDPAQADLNAVAQTELSREKVRESSAATATFSAAIISLVAKLNPALLRFKQAKNDAGELVDTEEQTIDGKKVKLSDITALNAYPTMQLAQTAVICLGMDKYRKWKADQGPEFSKALEADKKAKKKAEAEKAEL